MLELYGRITAGLVVVSSQGADGFPGPVGVPGEKGKKVTAQKRQTVIKTLKSTNISIYMCTHVSIMCFSGSTGSCRGRRSEGT